MNRVCTSRIVRTKELTERLGISRVTLWRWERQGRVPRKRQLGPNTVGWLESEIEAWFATTAPSDIDGCPDAAEYRVE